MNHDGRGSRRTQQMILPIPRSTSTCHFAAHEVIKVSRSKDLYDDNFDTRTYFAIDCDSD
jgi:hypothetical protein